MKFFATLAIALFLAVPILHAQESPDDQYVVIYVLIQQGDANLNSGQPQQALQNYIEAQHELQRFAQVYSDWNPKIVNFRLNYLAEKIAALTPQTPAATNVPPPPPPPTPADWQAQLSSLNGKIQQLEGNNENLESKLKEALSAQPATVSADAYAQMQQQVRELTKENDLLKATVTQATNTASAVPAPTAAPAANPQMEQEQQALAAETARASQLAQEDDALEARILTLTTDASAADALRQENALLKKELASLNSTPAANGNNDMAAMHDQTSLDAAADWLEKTALENRVRQWQEAALNSAGAGQLNATSSGQDTTALVSEVQTLQARVAADEAHAVPYSPQELALFVPPTLTPNLKSRVPGASAILVAQAQNYATSGEYDKAAADYQQILQREPTNSAALANLAAIELQQNQMADADRHIQAALATQPNDAFNLTVLGRIRYAQGNYDAALNALAVAAQLDPQNPQIQNFLGIAFAQKGMRAPAETAFRKALELNADYGEAHKNLAILYLNANPPQVELARWHYEKALSDGVPANPDLEKMLNTNNAK